MVDEFDINLNRYSPNIKKLYERMSLCQLCPRNCQVKRYEGEIGYCGIGMNPLVSSVGPHFGEESCLVGGTGSGTIFFAGCNLSCIFCQNYDISQEKHGSEMTVEELSEAMLKLQDIYCCNINFVSPSHVSGIIACAIEMARTKGLKLPIVYNSGGYDSVETLKLLEPFIDIYMPDIKYADPVISGELSDADNYPEIAFAAVEEMYRQKGDLYIENGVAQKGLLIRHLVLPDELAGSIKIINFLCEHISINTHINIMDQYRPCHKVDIHPHLNRSTSREEIEQVRLYAKQKGLVVLKG